MISVLPNESWSFNTPNSLNNIDSVIEELTRRIWALEVFITDVIVRNNTKYCVVTIIIENKQMLITVKNPKDEEFDLNEFENPITPLKFTGR
jgi:ABC-type lipopolysaccharide export system ATPase subunit